MVDHALLSLSVVEGGYLTKLNGSVTVLQAINGTQNNVSGVSMDRGGMKWRESVDVQKGQFGTEIDVELSRLAKMVKNWTKTYGSANVPLEQFLMELIVYQILAKMEEYGINIRKLASVVRRSIGTEEHVFLLRLHATMGKYGIVDYTHVFVQTEPFQTGTNVMRFQHARTDKCTILWITNANVLLD